MTDKHQITLVQIEARCTPKIFQRGQTYYEEGAIYKRRMNGDGVDALCSGSERKPYHVSALWKNGQLVWTQCDCPYDYEGDCKHVVALLLTCLYHPEKISTRTLAKTTKPIAPSKSRIIQPPQMTPPPAPKPPQNVPLMQRQHHELVRMVNQMLQRYPDLDDIVNPIPPSSEAGSYRRLLQRALYQYANTMDEEESAHEIVRITTIGDDHAKKGDWERATEIYNLILESFAIGSIPHYYPLQGFFAVAINGVVGSIERCLAQLTEMQTRLWVLNALVQLWSWQVRYNNAEVGGDVQTLLYTSIRPEEVPPMQRWVKLEMNLGRHENNWAVQQAKYDNFLRMLGAMRSQKPTRLIQELSTQGMLHAYIKRLALLGQVKEAVQVLTTELRHGSRRAEGLQALWDGGQQAWALSLAKDGMATHLDSDVIEWVLKMCHQHDPYKEVIVEWMVLHVRCTRQMNHYDALKEMAQIQNRWDAVYPQLIDEVQASGDNALLINIYLHDEKWDLAWRTLRKVEASPEGDSDGLDLHVAQASCDEYPERAIPVYMKYVHQHIGQRNREGYAEAVRLLGMVQGAYEQQDEFERWERVIATLRTQYKALRTLQNELKRAGL